MSVRILTEAPTVSCIAEMGINPDGLQEMMAWVADRAPACLPEPTENGSGVWDLFPHDLRDADGGPVSENELLVELAGRKCYNSFGLKAGRKSNAEYIKHALTTGPFGHASIAYHAKMSFFIGGVSRRVSHELIRHFVGADRDEEGNPSQESTRFTENPGFFVCPPKFLNDKLAISDFEFSVGQAYNNYKNSIATQVAQFKRLNSGSEPKSMDRKRIYEAAAGLLPSQVETSFIWTTNPAALTKLFIERCDEAADAEFRRLAETWKDLCLARWPALFPKLT